MTTHFKTHSDFLAVDVPRDASGYKLNEDCLYFDIKHGLGNELASLPKGKYEIIGLQSEIEKSEELARLVVERVTTKDWKNYLDPSQYFDRTFQKPTESFQSLMQSLGLTKESEILILKKT